ncbi:MAG: ATP-binding protein [Crenarchaeota archaeon]|nr:ATP-binding protein [Thermoproteota archaeon]MCR8455608.1 ATP-binding protein [Thermoproteota archaeon]MCR8470760.1 ATP-binding protein [Thermoproteota archaeon]MCR8471960.1 ATP-binding protein [Thermoproteota archaeon]MCR8486961.1 ATP-binding protein [Thermoproteota archaeon]
MSYYEVINSPDQLVGAEGFLRLPSYIYDEFVFDDNRSKALDEAIEHIKRGECVLIIGKAGTGKTALLSMVLRRLMDMGYRVAKVINGEVLRRDHESAGIVLFYDDIPGMDIRSLRSIVENRPRMLIATSRIELLDELRSKLGEKPDSIFRIVLVEEMAEKYLNEILSRFARREGIEVKPEAADVVVKKAGRLPVYIWQVIRDLVISRRNVLDIDFANKIPEGMLEYVDRILWSVVGDADDRLETLLTLMTMTLMPEYEMHQDLFDAVYIEARREIKGEEAPPRAVLLGSQTLNKIRRYLARAPHYSFRLPHDSWADVLKGKSRGLLSGEIADLLYIFPEASFRELLRKAAERAFEEAISKSKDPNRIREFIRQVNLIGFGDIISKRGIVSEAKQLEQISVETKIPVMPKPMEEARVKEELPKPSIEREMRTSVRLYAIATRVFSPLQGNPKLKITDVTEAIISSSSYRSYCSIDEKTAISKMLFRKRGDRLVLQYPCWGDMSITETISILKAEPTALNTALGVVLILIGVALMMIPIIGWIVGIGLIVYTAETLLKGTKANLVQLDLSGRKDEVESLIREVRYRLKRPPILISTEIKELIRRALGADPIALEKEWHMF